MGVKQHYFSYIQHSMTEQIQEEKSGLLSKFSARGPDGSFGQILPYDDKGQHACILQCQELECELDQLNSSLWNNDTK